MLNKQACLKMSTSSFRQVFSRNLRGNKVFAKIKVADPLTIEEGFNVIKATTSIGRRTVPMLSYYIALIKGTGVDQPRNLAKSMTVE